MSNAEYIDDAELISRCKAGDETAFDALVDRYSTRAYQLAYSVLRNREDAEEVAQDTFLRINRSLDKFRGDCKFPTWLHRIAMNLAINKYRWNKTRKQSAHFSIDAPIEGKDNEDRTFEIPDASMAPDKVSQDQELGRLVAEALEKLPENYRQPLLMQNIEGMTYEDIASAMKCKIGTVKSRISRAREALHNLLSGQ